MKNRTMPYGYELRDGKCCVSRSEAEIVTELFTAYTHGASYKELAEHMAGRGVPYHDGDTVWSKNKVARILNCAAYLGTPEYPALIDRSLYDAAMARKPAYTGQEVIPLVLVFSDTGSQLKEGVHYQAALDNNIRCGLGRAVITGIGTCADPNAGPIVEYFAIVPDSPEILSLSAQSGEIRLSVKDLSDTGADGYEARYRLKGTDDWTSASFEKDQTGLVIGGLAAGEYEVQARAFVDNTDADLTVEAYNRRMEYGDYGELRTILVP